MNKCHVMTTAAGNPAGDNQNSLTASTGAWRMPGTRAPGAHSR